MQFDNFRLAGQGAEQARNVADAVKSEVDNAREAKGVNLDKNWDMYEGRHAKYFKPRLNEDEQLFSYRKSNSIIANKIGFIVDLSAKYLYGKASKVRREFGDDNSTNVRMHDLLRLISFDSLMFEASKKASVFGEQPCRIVAVDSLTKMQPEGGITTETTYPHPILLDPRKCRIKKNLWGKIVAVVFEYEANDYVRSVKEKVTELIVDDSRWVWRETYNPGSSAPSGPPTMMKNPVKLSDEFVLLVNNEERVSDIESILDLNIALDEAYTDMNHFHGRHGWPQLFSALKLEDTHLSPGKILNAEGVADEKKALKDYLYPLTWEGHMKEAQDYLKALEREIFILSSTAQISTGDLAAIGQLRSGAALITAHAVAIHKTQAKQIVWEQNEVALLKALVNMDSYYHNESPESRYKGLNIRIKYPRDFVPGDELVRADIQTKKLNSHAVSLKEILKDDHPDLTGQEIDDMFEQILEESERLVDSTRKFVSATEAPGGVSGKSGSSMQKSKEQSTPTGA